MIDGLELFYNYSEMMLSTPKVSEGSKDNPTNYTFTIDKVPMIRKAYLTDEVRMTNIVSEIQSRREYIQYCLNLLEDGFDIDFKFFNTYGPSKRFTLDGDENYINTPNLSLTFRTSLYSNTEKYIIDLIKSDIKEAIENIDEISDVHMTNISHDIYEKYSDQIEYFDFTGFNGYGPGETHIYQIETQVMADVPEFLNVNTLANDEPDIEITII